MQMFDSSTEEHELNENQMSVDKIKQAMTQLPAGGRLVFSLYLLEGYDHVEISQILDISESTSKSQYMRAKNRVRELLSAENGE